MTLYRPWIKISSVRDSKYISVVVRNPDGSLASSRSFGNIDQPENWITAADYMKDILIDYIEQYVKERARKFGIILNDEEDEG